MGVCDHTTPPHPRCTLATLTVPGGYDCAVMRENERLRDMIEHPTGDTIPLAQAREMALAAGVANP